MFAIMVDMAICLTILTYAIMMIAYFRIDAGYLVPRLTLYAGLGICTTAIVFNLLSDGSESPLRSVLAMSLTVLSQLLFWSAKQAHGQFKPSAIFSSSTPSGINQSGPYAYVRHPFYAAYILVFSAGAISIGSIPAITIPLFAIAIYGVGSNYEESQFYRSNLRDEYLQYASHTGRFLPKMGLLIPRMVPIAAQDQSDPLM